MNLTVQKWGNSFAVRLPRELARTGKFSEGTQMTADVQDGSIILRPVESVPSLDELVAKITPKNRHPETDWGGPVGKEAW
jgi:antitoxin MazE